MTKQELNSVVGEHIYRGCPEADNKLNGANIAYIRDRAKHEQNVKLLKFEPFSIHEPGERIYNFSCNYVVNATAEDYPHIEQIVKDACTNITLKKLEDLYQTLEREYNGECVIWS